MTVQAPSKLRYIKNVLLSVSSRLGHEPLFFDCQLSPRQHTFESRNFLIAMAAREHAKLLDIHCGSVRAPNTRVATRTRAKAVPYFRSGLFNCIP
jgi:hypothetical protein